MFSLLFPHPAPNREEYLIAELAECGTTGITEEVVGIRAFFDDSVDLQSLVDQFSEFAPEIRHEDSTDWAEVTRDAWPALLVGERYFLTPPWRENEPTPSGRVQLRIYPGMACGTGRHPATQLCLKAIERCVRPGDQVLDVGSGSGILAEAAALMGAARVVACDRDPEAVEVARGNYDSPEFFVGSVDAVQSHWADVIVANIDSATLEKLAPELERVAKIDSTLIVSGFPAWDSPEGLSPRTVLEQGDWRCWII